MDFEWPEEVRALRAEAVAFARDALAEGVGDDDRAERFPLEKWRRLADWGYFGLCVPEELGGAGLDPLAGLAVTEGLGEACGDGGLLFSAAVQAWVVIPALLRFGSDEQRRRFVPRLADGGAVGAFAITEPDAGSDAFALRTTAKRLDDGWSLSGRKAYVTNGPLADVVVVFAASGRGGALGGTTAFLVERGTRGFEQEPAAEKMGLRTSPLGDLVLDDVVIPADNVLGDVGAGLRVFNEVLEWERIWPMALHVGALSRELEQTRRYARERRAFGAPISRNQAIAHRLVDMKVRLEAGRLLLYRAAWLKAAGEPAATESAIAKLFLSESAVSSSLDSLQIHGGYGYMVDGGVERRVRDAIGSRIYSGTSEMQRAVIARSLGL
jgi:alkylation response protein AidB-like acyl-CoA dehydrogenase